MLGRDGKWKYGDLGLARRAATPRAKNTTGGGTPWYIAPEQDKDQFADSVGPAADTFALGASLLEALAFTCNNVTFPERTAEKSLNKNQVNSIKTELKKRSLSRGLDLLEMATSMCDIDPSKRPSPKELKQVVEGYKKKWGIQDGVEA